MREKIEGLNCMNVKPSEAHKYMAYEVSEVRQLEKQLDMAIKALGKIYNKSYVFLSNMERFEYRQTLSKLKDNQEKEQ